MKKYIIIAIVLVIIAGLIWAGAALSNQYKQNKCEQYYHNSQKLLFYITKCVSECPFDSRANLDPCIKLCTNASQKLNKELGLDSYRETESCLNHLVEIGYYSQPYPKSGYFYSEPAAVDLKNCTNSLLPSIVRHATNNSIIVDKSCIQDIEQKYPELTE